MARMLLISLFLMTMAVMMTESLHFQHFPVREGRPDKHAGTSSVVSVASQGERTQPRSLKIPELGKVAKKQNNSKARKLVKPDVDKKAQAKEETKTFLKTKLDVRKKLNVNRKRKKVANQRQIKNITKSNKNEVEQLNKKDERMFNQRQTQQIKSTNEKKTEEKSRGKELANRIKTKSLEDENDVQTFFNIFKNLQLPDKNSNTFSKPYFSYVVVL